MEKILKWVVYFFAGTEFLTAGGLMLSRFVIMIDRSCFFSLKADFPTFCKGGDICDAGLPTQLIISAALGWSIQIAAFTVIAVLFKSRLFLFSMGLLSVCQLLCFVTLMSIVIGLGIPFVPYGITTLVFITLTLILSLSTVMLGRAIADQVQGFPDESQQLLPIEPHET